MKKGHQKTTTKLALRIARAQLRAIRQYAAPDVASQAKPGPPQFLQCWAVGRGYSGVTQALDASGQVWERWTKGSKSSTGQFEIEESYWYPLPMERRERKETA